MGVVIFNMLSGEQPFGYRRVGSSRNFSQESINIYTDIRKGRFNFDPYYWCNVSEEAKVCLYC